MNKPLDPDVFLAAAQEVRHSHYSCNAVYFVAKHRMRALREILRHEAWYAESFAPGTQERLCVDNVENVVLELDPVLTDDVRAEFREMLLLMAWQAAISHNLRNN